MDAIRKMKSLKLIGVGGRSPVPAAVFWKKLKAGELK
jgi:hypothetical protein